MHDFVASCIVYLENNGSHQAHSDFPNVDLFHNKISKHHIWYHHHQAYQKKSVKYWEAVKDTMAEIDFPKLEFFS